jgi:HEAT repeat protein
MDPHEFTRANAATALGYIGDSSDVPVLVVALRDSGVFGRVRSSAAEALGSLKDASAVPALREAVQDRHPTVRANAIFALAEICGLSVVSEILQALADNNGSVREHAIYALINLDTAAIPVLEEALNHSSEAIRSGATDALRRIHENKTDHEQDGDPFIEPVNGTRPSGSNPEV